MNLSFLSCLPFIGYKFKKPTVQIEYVKTNLSDNINLPQLDNTLQYECKCCMCIYDRTEIITCTKSSESELHTFCKSCVSDYINSGINSGKIKNICMCAGCDGIISEQCILKCTNEETYNKFEEMYEIYEVKKFHKILDNYQTCPHCFKYGAVICKDVMKCKKKDCKKKWCTLCKKAYESNHICKKINDAKNIDAIRTLVEETINMAIMHKCPKCSSMYVKEDGCNHMTCSICNANSCYICGYLLNRHIGTSCPQYNNYDNDTSRENGNWLYDRQKILGACVELVRANDSDVRIIIIEELKKNKIYIDIDDV